MTWAPSQTILNLEETPNGILIFYLYSIAEVWNLVRWLREGLSADMAARLGCMDEEGFSEHFQL